MLCNSIVAELFCGTNKIRRTSKKMCTHKCNSSLFSKSLTQSNKNKLSASFGSWLELTSQRNVTIRKQNKAYLMIYEEMLTNCKHLEKIHFSTILRLFVHVCACVFVSSSVPQKWSASKIVYSANARRRMNEKEEAVCLLHEYNSGKSYGVRRLYKWLITVYNRYAGVVRV